MVNFCAKSSEMRVCCSYSWKSLGDVDEDEDVAVCCFVRYSPAGPLYSNDERTQHWVGVRLISANRKIDCD